MSACKGHPDRPSSWVGPS